MGLYSRAMRPVERVAIAMESFWREHLENQGMSADEILNLLPPQVLAEEYMASVIEYEREDARMDEHNNKGRAAAARDRGIEIAGNLIALRNINISKIKI